MTPLAQLKQQFQLDAIYTAKRDVRTFAELSHAADMLMQTAQQYLTGNLYTALSSLLLRAFTFEAYLNHLGERHLKLWDARKQLRSGLLQFLAQ